MSNCKKKKYPFLRKDKTRLTFRSNKCENINNKFRSDNGERPFCDRLVSVTTVLKLDKGKCLSHCLPNHATVRTYKVYSVYYT